MSTTTQCLDNMLIVQPKPGRSTRTGLSLVELLVVIAILLLVTVTAIPLLSPSDVQKVRDAAITVNGMISRVKTAAAAHEQRGAGLWLQPLSDDSGAVLDMFTSLSLDPYCGDDIDTAKAFVYKPRGGSVDFGNIDPADGTPDGSSVEFAFLPAVSDDIRIVLFPSATCASIWDFCRSSSRITISGNDYFFRLIPPANVQSTHLPQPYRKFNEPNCEYRVTKASGGIEAAREGVPRHPDFSGLADFDFGHSYWAYPQISWQNECSVAVVRPLSGSPLPANHKYFKYAASDPTPANLANTTFKVARPNTRAPTPPLTLPSGYAIDLQWSGWGNKLLRPEVNQDSLVFSGFAAIDAAFVLTEPVQLMFSKDGLPAELVFRKTEIIYLTTEIVDAYFTNLGDIFLLVGRADRCGNEFLEAAFTDSNVLGANWQYPDSRWIRITRATGQVTISEPYPNARTLNESLIYAKAGISAGRG